MPGADMVIRPIHGMLPAGHADRLLAELGRLRQHAGHRRHTAKPGRYRSALRGFGPGSEQITTRAVYNLTDITAVAAEPIAVTDSPRLDQVEFGADALRKMADRIDTARGQHHRRTCIEAILGTLPDSEGKQVTGGLQTRAGGPISVLQAPTGIGKTVTFEVMATVCAESQVPVAIVVPTRASALRLTREIETNLKLLSIAASCSPLLAPGRNMKDAEAAAAADPGGHRGWVYQRLSYGCALSAKAEVEGTVDAWNPGEESCHEPYEIRQDGRRGSALACPWQRDCENSSLNARPSQPT
jgi:hypothetical protein